MSKQITFNYNGVDYTLEFTKKSIKALESKGFQLSDVSEKPMTSLPALFAGSFIAHHKFVSQDLIDEIYSKMPNKEDLIDKLAEMYFEPINALFSDPEDDEGNLEWGASW